MDLYENQIEEEKQKRYKENKEMVLQILKENQNIKLTPEQIFDYYLKNKSLPFGRKMNILEVRKVVVSLFIDGKIKQSVANTGTYEKVVRYYFEVLPENNQTTLF